MSHFPPSANASSTNLLQGSEKSYQQQHLRTSASNASLRTNDSRYTALRNGGSPIPSSISDKFAMSPDPAAWGGNVAPGDREPDDELHNPDPRRDRKNDKGGTIFTARGISNLGCLAILFLGITMLFAGYPLLSHFLKHPPSSFGGFNIGGTNASGQIAAMPGNFALIDRDTPQSAYTKPDPVFGKKWELVFSDEFNVDGRTFYPGDDPYWEAVDLHYWQTNNMEWYDPAAVTTRNGSLEITLSKKETHGLDYQGGMITTWNKFCYTGGYLETSVVLPGISNIVGLWPAVWTMGNLGRAGYGASLEGMWPYTYDSCDVGTVANQTLNGLPIAATENGDPTENGALSFLQGQRLSRCTCQGESHPGPVHSDGTYVGRAAPEIDVFEATITGDPLRGQVSQSSQWAPFNAEYTWDNSSQNLNIPNETITILNSYKGAAFQMATSALTFTDPDAYELAANKFAVYGMTYKPGFDDAYIGWVTNGKLAWQLNVDGLKADPTVEISARPVPQEPMYMLINLGISRNFGFVDLDHLTFPTVMKVDYIRVYQDPSNKNIGCDPVDFPTAAYIDQYIDAYTNPNLTTWVDDYKQVIPKNRFLGQC
ncbi:beta-glucan synthesis-associated [Trametopsis cervina]|nr:beta-glucan synthesis-associated [Trametopsis cervina]